MSRLGEKIFEDEVEAKYKCPICLFVLKDPVQTPLCGHLFCRPCITTVIRRFASVCPLDNTSLKEAQLQTDKAVRREMSFLKVKCPNEGYGCSWKGTLGQFEERHQNHCPFFPVGTDQQTKQAVEHHQV